MAQARIIKKYPNRRLYDTEISSYITLEEVRQLVLDGERPDHRSRSEHGFLTVGVAPDDADQRDATVLHNDVDPVATRGSRSWCALKLSQCEMTVRRGRVPRQKVVRVNALEQRLPYPIVLCGRRQWLYLVVDSNHAIHALDGLPSSSKLPESGV